MISIIICSIHPEQAKSLKKNILETIGLAHEVIIWDNRNKPDGLCKVYNHCAKKARYDYLCFMHEDVLFHTQDWGSSIVKHLEHPQCGVIGFAGSSIKCKTLSGWYQSQKYNAENYTQHSRNKLKTHIYKSITSELTFSPCITLDGLALFVRKKVWEEHPFDETLLTGFHGYDLDFSLQVAQQYSNYVCNIIDIGHFSEGNYNSKWVEATILIHKKWKSQLPLYIGDLTYEEVEENDCMTNYQFIRTLLKTDYPLSYITSMTWQYMKRTSFKKHSIGLTRKLIKTACKRAVSFEKRKKSL